MEFEELIGREFEFYGVDNQLFKLGHTVWEAHEDPDDGYRSYLDTILEVNPEVGTFSRTPLAVVRVTEVSDNVADGYQLVDVEDGHVWLHVGTNETDYYYPYFVFDYQPKQGEEA